MKTSGVYYKCLTADGRGTYSGLRWSLPTRNEDGSYTPGEWMPVIKGKLTPCKKGYHGCKAEHLIYWIHDTVFAMEFRGNVIPKSNKVVGREARTLYPLEAWTRAAQYNFRADVAEHVLPIFEAERPDDPRVRDCIAVIRRYAIGKATQKELDAAARAAYAAANVAAYAAYVAAYAAYAAAADAARAAYAAASVVADAARAAAAAASVVADAARAAAADAAASVVADARAAEIEWQTARLMEYLEGKL
jgi:hypothetical protein